MRIDGFRRDSSGMPDESQKFDVELEVTYLLTCRITEQERVIIMAAHNIIGGLFLQLSEFDPDKPRRAENVDPEDVQSSTSFYGDALAALMRNVHDQDMVGMSIRSISVAGPDLEV